MSADLNSKQRKTLAAVFAKPPRKDMRWAEIENLFVGLEADVEEREGSRVAIALRGELEIFHRPHPHPTVGRKTIKTVMAFLIRAGITP